MRTHTHTHTLEFNLEDEGGWTDSGEEMRGEEGGEGREDEMGEAELEKLLLRNLSDDEGEEETKEQAKYVPTVVLTATLLQSIHVQ